jgi:IclR family transcriptional regulator, KDG regulon repressor
MKWSHAMSELNTVLKMGRVLELFTVQRPEWGVREVGETLTLPRSSVQSLMASLAQVGVLHRTSEGRYRLGWRVLSLSQVLMASSDVRMTARPIMEELVTQHGETLHLGALETGRVVYVEKLQGTRAIRVSVTGIGAELPAHCSGLGKVLLAYLPWEEVLTIIESRGLPQLTENTITNIDELRSELNRVRQQGFAYDIEEVVPELCCVAAPIRNHAGAVVAAVSFSLPAYRFYEAKPMYRKTILEAARTISGLLGFSTQEDVWERKPK